MNVAKAKILGEGVAKNVNGGLGQLDAMCTGGEVEGCKALANVYEWGLGDVQADANRSADYVKRACDLNDKNSCARRDLQKSLDLTATAPAHVNAELRDQCDAGKMTSCAMLGRNLNDGVGAPKDPVAGAKYLGMACKGGETTACAPGSR